MGPSRRLQWDLMISSLANVSQASLNFQPRQDGLEVGRRTGSRQGAQKDTELKVCAGHRVTGEKAVMPVAPP